MKRKEINIFGFVLARFVGCKTKNKTQKKSQSKQNKTKDKENE
jgi:hypothetical protein